MPDEERKNTAPLLPGGLFDGIDINHSTCSTSSPTTTATADPYDAIGLISIGLPNDINAVNAVRSSRSSVPMM